MSKPEILLTFNKPEKQKVYIFVTYVQVNTSIPDGKTYLVPQLHAYHLFTVFFSILFCSKVLRMSLVSSKYARKCISA